LRVWFARKRKRNLMARYPTTAEETDPTKNIAASWASMPSPAASARLNPAAAAVTGTLIRKEKRAASSRLRPKNSPQVIVAPDLETPGTRAAAWARPTPKAPKKPSFGAPSVFVPTASATRNSTPTNTRLKTTQGERTCVAKKSRKKNPISAAGTVAIRIR
jgi:hypothetical protein